jgi:hypothetical protein
MQLIKQHVGAAGVLACFTLLALSAPAAAARSGTVSGTFTEPAPPVLTAYNPKTGGFSGYGSSMWTGTWTGVTYWTIKGTVNLLTGDSSGTLDETFIGHSADGGTGTLHFLETYTVKGATGAFHDDATLVGGSGDFARSRGKVTFDGLDLPTGQGEGTYNGTWLRGRSAPPIRRPQPSPRPKHHSGAVAPRLHVIAWPRTVRAQCREWVRFRVTARGRPVAHAWVMLNRHRVQTNGAGRSVLMIRLPRPGRYRVVARHPRMTRASTSERATRADTARCPQQQS